MNLAVLHIAIPESQLKTYGCQNCAQQELGVWTGNKVQIILWSSDLGLD